MSITATVEDLGDEGLDPHGFDSGGLEVRDQHDVRGPRDFRDPSGAMQEHEALEYMERSDDPVDTGIPQSELSPWGSDTGATTAEYAITTLAACGFAALLVVILKSEPIKETVTGIIQAALGLGS